MEVHHHAHPTSGATHTASKKWTHYFWEFLMLSLAVFSGFLAENLREHYIEHKRSLELAISLKADLIQDTAIIKNILAFRNNRTDVLDKVLDEIEKPMNLQNDTLLVLAEDELFRRSYFIPETGTYDQIKQAGFLRYFQKELGNALVRYESRRNLAAIQLDMENKFVLENVIILLNKLSNQKFLRYRDKDSVILFGEPLIRKDSAVLSELYGAIRFLQKRNLTYVYTLNDLYFLSRKSIDLLNKEFKLK